MRSTFKMFGSGGVIKDNKSQSIFIRAYDSLCDAYNNTHVRKYSHLKKGGICSADTVKWVESELGLNRGESKKYHNFREKLEKISSYSVEKLKSFVMDEQQVAVVKELLEFGKIMQELQDGSQLAANREKRQYRNDIKSIWLYSLPLRSQPKTVIDKLKDILKPGQVYRFFSNNHVIAGHTCPPLNGIIRIMDPNDPQGVQEFKIEETANLYNYLNKRFTGIGQSLDAIQVFSPHDHVAKHPELNHPELMVLDRLIRNIHDQAKTTLKELENNLTAKEKYDAFKPNFEELFCFTEMYFKGSRSLEEITFFLRKILSSLRASDVNFMEKFGAYEDQLITFIKQFSEFKIRKAAFKAIINNPIPGDIQNNLHVTANLSDAVNFPRIMKVPNTKYDINAPGSDGLTLLHRAIVVNNLELLRVLIGFGADVNKLDGKRLTLFHYPNTLMNLELLEMILRASCTKDTLYVCARLKTNEQALSAIDLIKERLKFSKPNESDACCLLIKIVLNAHVINERDLLDEGDQNEFIQFLMNHPNHFSTFMNENEKNEKLKKAVAQQITIDQQAIEKILISNFTKITLYSPKQFPHKYASIKPINMINNHLELSSYNPQESNAFCQLIENLLLKHTENENGLLEEADQNKYIKFLMEKHPNRFLIFMNEKIMNWESPNNDFLRMVDKIAAQLKIPHFATQNPLRKGGRRLR